MQLGDYGANSSQHAGEWEKENFEPFKPCGVRKEYRDFKKNTTSKEAYENSKRNEVSGYIETAVRLAPDQEVV